MIVLDTHVLYWWLGDPLRLSATARDWTEQTGINSKTILISTVTLWELEYKRRAGKLTFSVPLREAWSTLKLLIGFMFFASVRIGFMTRTRSITQVNVGFQ